MIGRVAAAAAVVTASWSVTLIVLAVLAGVTWLAAAGKVDAAAAVGLYTLVVGYVFGASKPAPTGGG